MTIITVVAPEGRLDLETRRKLVPLLTDAVMVAEIGRLHPPARVGFQVHFQTLARDAMAIGGKLLCDHEKPRDVMTINLKVMDAVWPDELRARAITGVLAAMAEGCGLPAPSPTWWVNLEVVPEGSWGSRGRVLSILDLLETGAFTEERAAEIRAALPA
ncbi:MAG: tautomerase enzyme [Burkholderiaceae bacterium]|nr:tautomerase enzyme [Burkholderiaceae bacterium]